ncbi:MAG TPA: phenylalanine--tRNA ligase subunit beta, partial [Burkholderiales bacterium]|nr:phenylalanine--tRNA ligase subunit beta [Burkholderiales bacterium]
MGDAVLDISILPNMARNANVIGIARELAAATGRKHKQLVMKLKTDAESIKGKVSIQIADPKLNPRFVVGLIRDVQIKPSPYQIQRRLKLAGVRPINNIVDASNYAMLELGEPLHAFDYDVLKERAGGKAIRISTRAARAGEKLTTLDGAQRTLTAVNVLVCDEKGPISLAGVMGGVESEVYDASGEVLDAQGIEMKHDELPAGKASARSQSTTSILLEGAAWNFINIRRTAKQHNLPSEASFRFSRGVHPALAELGVRRGLQLMAAWSGGKVVAGLVDEYPLKPKDPTIVVTPADVKRLLGIELSAQEIVKLLERLEFKCKIKGSTPAAGKSKIKSAKSKTAASSLETKISVTAPPHRLDIGEGSVGLADVLEEVARLYGYDRIPETRMADPLPPQIGNSQHEWEEHLRDILVSLGLQEVVTYRMTSPERQSAFVAQADFVKIANPIVPERRVLRRSLVASLLEIAERNARSESMAFFELGPVFEPRDKDLPDESRRLALVMSGARDLTAWDRQDSAPMDFFDMKGRIELLMGGLRYLDVTYAPTDTVNYLHPGKAAQVLVNGQAVGTFGELHPLVKAKYELGAAPVLVADLDLAALRSAAPAYGIEPVPEFPPVLEDIAVIVDESVPAARVEGLIRQTGGATLSAVRLFDVFRGEQIGAGKKSLAYSLTYQAPAKTLTDAEAAAIRNKIVKRLEQEVGAKLRS